MIQLNRILVPTDFSEFSQPALTYGCAMASRFDGQLHLLHVCPDPVMLMPDVAGLGAIDLNEHADTLQESAKEQLDELPGDGWENREQIVRSIATGSPFLEIIRYAQENAIDLIVIGTHGRSGLTHLLMGSVAENVVRKAPCPVLTVKPDGHQFVMP